MDHRLELHNELIELLGSPNVYYQPPASTRMEYDAIRYSKKDIISTFASNRLYLYKDCYEIIVISRLPDHPVIKKLLELPYCSFDRHYVAENLYHDVLTLYK